jgi:hypothetical protein
MSNAIPESATRVASQVVAGAAAFVLLAVVCTAQAGSQGPRKIPLSDVAGTPTGRLAAIQGWALISDAQSAASGLIYSLVVRNDSKETVHLYDPAERSQPQLLTSEGWPIALPVVVPSWRMDKHGTPKVVSLSAGQEYTIPVVVREVLGVMRADQAARGRIEGATPSPIAAGSYKLKMRLALADSDAAAGSPGALRMLESAELTVTLRN